VSSWYNCAEESHRTPPDLLKGSQVARAYHRKTAPVSPVSDIPCVYRLRSNPRQRVGRDPLAVINRAERWNSSTDFKE
jgi:hypothetical protein